MTNTYDRIDAADPNPVKPIPMRPRAATLSRRQRNYERGYAFGYRWRWWIFGAILMTAFNAGHARAEEHLYVGELGLPIFARPLA